MGKSIKESFSDVKLVYIHNENKSFNANMVTVVQWQNSIAIINHN